jgi:hypothetical protein
MVADRGAARSRVFRRRTAGRRAHTSCTPLPNRCTDQLCPDTSIPHSSNVAVAPAAVPPPGRQRVAKPRVQREAGHALELPALVIARDARVPHDGRSRAPGGLERGVLHEVRALGEEAARAAIARWNEPAMMGVPARTKDTPCDGYGMISATGLPLIPLALRKSRWGRAMCTRIHASLTGVIAALRLGDGAGWVAVRKESSRRRVVAKIGAEFRSCRDIPRRREPCARVRSPA